VLSEPSQRAPVAPHTGQPNGPYLPALKVFFAGESPAGDGGGHGAVKAVPGRAKKGDVGHFAPLPSRSDALGSSESECRSLAGRLVTVPEPPTGPHPHANQSGPKVGPKPDRKKKHAFSVTGVWGVMPAPLAYDESPFPRDCIIFVCILGRLSRGWACKLTSYSALHFLKCFSSFH
jgi:hypothetical protein